MREDEIKRIQETISRYKELMRIKHQGGIINCSASFRHGGDKFNLPKDLKKTVDILFNQACEYELKAIEELLVVMGVDRESIVIKVPGTVYGPEGGETWNRED